VSFLKIKLLSFLTEIASQETKSWGSNTIHTSLAFIDNQGLPPWDLLEDRTEVARIRDGLVGGNENVKLQFCVSSFYFVMRQLIPPHNLATLGFAIVGDHS